MFYKTSDFWTVKCISTGFNDGEVVLLLKQLARSSAQVPPIVVYHKLPARTFTVKIIPVPPITKFR